MPEWVKRKHCKEYLNVKKKWWFIFHIVLEEPLVFCIFFKKNFPRNPQSINDFDFLFKYKMGVKTHLFLLCKLFVILISTVEVSESVSIVIYIYKYFVWECNHLNSVCFLQLSHIQLRWACRFKISNRLFMMM